MQSEIVHSVTGSLNFDSTFERCVSLPDENATKALSSLFTATHRLRRHLRVHSPSRGQISNVREFHTAGNITFRAGTGRVDRER